MGKLQKYLSSLLLAVFITIAVVGGWQVLQRFEGVRTGLPVEVLKWHRNVSSLIQALGNLTESLAVAQTDPSDTNINQLTIALDTAIVVERASLGHADIQDRMGTRAVREELSRLLLSVEKLLENPGAFDQAEARRQHVRMVYLSNELETAYLRANEDTVSQLKAQGEVLDALKVDTLILLALIMAAIGIIFVFLTRAHRANVLLSASQADLKDRKRVLNAANDRLEHAQRLARLGSWSWDVANGDVTWSNEAFRIFGHQPHAVKATYDKFMEAVHPDDRDRVQNAIAEALENKLPYGVEHRVVLADGEERFVVEQGEASYGKDGAAIRMGGTVLDVTDLKKAQLEAEDANKAKSEFLSSMSHELRTPLNAICGFSQLLETDRKNPLTEKQVAMVHEISKGGTHLLTLINDILDLAKIEAGKLSISIEEVVPDQLLASAMSLVEDMAANRNVRMAYDRSVDCANCANPCAVMVDQSRFSQVLLNLLSNAVKYNRDGGEVALTCLRKDNGKMRFTVSDTGMGIPVSLQDDLFTPFHRLGAENGEIEGTGIGLVITKTLTELMGGKIGFDSREGEGVDFWVEFPVAKSDPQSLAQEQTPTARADFVLPPSDAPQRTVLYIEDNPANLSLMEMIFDRLDNVRMISAHNAELGLEMAARERPDLILMDINLPGMNGVAALKQIQSSETLYKTPVIAVSANAMKHDIEHAIQAGFKGYITKPFEVEEIIAAVASQLD